MLSHGQATMGMERGFSENNKVLNINMDEITFNSQELIIDHMNSHNLLPQSFPITESLLKLVGCSQQRYQEFLRQKESLQKENTQCAQLAIIDKEI